MTISTPEKPAQHLFDLIDKVETATTGTAQAAAMQALRAAVDRVAESFGTPATPAVPNPTPGVPARFDLEGSNSYQAAIAYLTWCIGNETPLLMGLVEYGRSFITWRGVPTGVQVWRNPSDRHWQLTVFRAGDSPAAIWRHVIEIVPQIGAED
ncbi:hypothetical protein [Nonomuraea sp. LPB2021202275-12-8]|uniref:hypothetical protein n=1 Tax=Nonomuraea sp. LPB2021202275-12-8 TaxID=3120159 RepID=UPI00300D5EA7